MATNTFSGNSYPQQVRSGEGKNEFTLPLDNPDPKQQVVGEENANRLYMPGRLRQYIPTLYKQVWLNTRAILSVNGYEIVENQPILDDADQQIGRKTTLLSDIRTSVLRSTNGDFKATTSELKEYEVGMTKLVISDGDDTTGAPRTLDAYTSGSTKYYFIEYSNDVVGVEVCSAIKNIYSMIIGAGQSLNSSSNLFQKAVLEMRYLNRYFKGKDETILGLAGVGDLYVSAAGGRNSKMGSFLGKGFTFKTAKKRFMPKETVEGEELAREITPFILKKIDKKKIPLMINLLKTIKENKKLKIKV